MMNVSTDFFHNLFTYCSLSILNLFCFFFRLKVFGLSSSVPGETATIKKPSAKPQKLMFVKFILVDLSRQRRRRRSTRRSSTTQSSRSPTRRISPRIVWLQRTEIFLLILEPTAPVFQTPAPAPALDPPSRRREPS